MTAATAQQNNNINYLSGDPPVGSTRLKSDGRQKRHRVEGDFPVDEVRRVSEVFDRKDVFVVDDFGHVLESDDGVVLAFGLGVVEGEQKVLVQNLDDEPRSLKMDDLLIC